MKKTLLFVVVLFLMVMVLAGCQPKPEELSMQLANAVNTKDLEGALNLFTEDAVVTSTSPEPFVGKEGVQLWLEGMFADNLQIEVESVEVKGDTVIEKELKRRGLKDGRVTVIARPKRGAVNER